MKFLMCAAAIESFKRQYIFAVRPFYHFEHPEAIHLQNLRKWYYLLT